MATDGGEDATDSRDDMMRATYRALCANGFANLTMQDIADEMGKSRTLLHYHYDTKGELLEAFLDRMIGWLRTRMAEEGPEHPVDRLVKFIEFFVIDPAEESESFARALLEMRLQAIHNSTFREKLTAHYQENVNVIAETIAAGIEDGYFADIDAESAGESIYTAMLGARTYQITLDAGPATARMARQIWSITMTLVLTEAARDHLDSPSFDRSAYPTLFPDAE